MRSSKTKNREPDSVLSPEDFEPRNIKERITIYLDQDILDKAREIAGEEHTRYQTLLNQTLREALLGEPSRRRKTDQIIDDLVERVARLEKAVG